MRGSRTGIAIAWVLSHPEVTCVITGAENPEHLEENLTGVRLELPDDALTALNKAGVQFSRRWEEENRSGGDDRS